jgi:hypothetical protein
MTLMEFPMNKLSALRFIAEHFGIEGQQSNLFNDMLFDRSTDLAEFTVKEIMDGITKEREAYRTARSKTNK